MLNKFLRKDSPTPPAPAPAPAEHKEAPAPGKPIYLISMAGYPNYGDELITLRWLQYLAATHPTTEVWLDVREPGHATSLFKHAHPKLHVTNTLFRAIHEHLHGDPRTPADKIRELSTPNYDLGIIDLREAGTLHLLGGGYINSLWPENQLLVDAMRATRDISGARLFATGQGLTPRNDETFEDFDHVSVRDLPSAEALSLETGLDDALLLPPGQSPASALQTGRPEELYLCIQNDALEPGAHEAMLAFARAQIEHFDIPKERTYYVEAIPGNDYAGYDALRDLVADDGFIPFSRFWRENFTYGPHQVWITSRFHHHLTGALHGARGIALNGQPGYYDVKHQSVLNLGSNWKLVSPLSDPQSPLNLTDLTAPRSFIHHIRAKRQEAQELYPNCPL